MERNLYFFSAFVLEEVVNCVILRNIEVKSAYMINEEKVILMTKAALYEEKESRKKLKLTKYFRHDYISLQMIGGWFFMTISFLLCAGLWGACNMEYLLDNIHKMDLKSLGMTFLLLYAAAVAVYLCILYGVYSYRYHMAQKSVGKYAGTLQKISDIYNCEEKNTGSGKMTEETKT